MRRLLPAVLALLAVLPARAAQAQAYPSRSISLVVPFAVEGPTDTVALLLLQPMSQSLGQQVIVENIGGAGGTLGAARVAKAAPDGYTLFLHNIGHSTAVSLYRKLSYDPVKDFEPIGEVVDVPMTLVTRKDFPARDLKELLAYVKANKDKVTYANAGVGSASHLCGLLLMKAIEAHLVAVPFKGTGPAMSSLLSGQVDLMCDQTTNTLSQIRGGQVKVFGVTTRRRLPSLPDVPTLAEGGLPGFELVVWHGLYAPRGTPKPVIDKLVTALQVALKDPDVKARLGELGTQPAPAERARPDALRARLQSEIERWKPILAKAAIYAD